MFVYSFKASGLKLIAGICACFIIVAAVVVFLPDAGSSLNVNKIYSVKELEKIDVRKESGRVEYLSALGYCVKEEAVNKAEETIPKVFDAATEKYNELQRAQGFDLSRCSGKKVKGYTYEIKTLPDGTNVGEGLFFATVVVCKNKVVAADVCCPSKGLYAPLVKAV